MDSTMSTFDLSVSSIAARRAVQGAAREPANANMPPETKAVGWRKKIQNKPKDLQPLTMSTEDVVVPGRHLFSRKGIQSSQSATPATPSTPAIEDTDDGSNERVQPTATRRSSKPKLVRYTSLFTSFKDVPERKSPQFAEPWSTIDSMPATESPYVDPVVTVQAVRSHMLNFSTTPLSSKYNNGLFCVFEHYYILRAENERKEIELQEARQDLKTTKDRWIDEERRYAEEIRRLELLIVQGTTGVAGVIHARHGSVVNRRHMHRKTISGDLKSNWGGFLTQEQIDAEIRSRSQNVLLQRSTSPSGKMAALSRHFTGKASVDLHVGTPPDNDRSPMLSRNAYSELDLIELANMAVENSIAKSSFDSEFSGGAGDPLPDEVSQPSPVPVELSAESDAFFALRELGTLIARRRGLDVFTFVENLILLFSDAEKAERRSEYIEQSQQQDNSTDSPKVHAGEATPMRGLRSFQSQPQMTSDIKRRRHFSFEPGEDHLQALKEEGTPNASARLHGKSSASGSLESGIFLHAGFISSSEGRASPYQDPSPDLKNLSKIPTPVLPFGSLRRQTSVSSLQSIWTISNDGRHNSQSSILTAFRDNQSIGLRPDPSSRNSSYNNLGGIDTSPSSTGHPSSIRLRHGVVIPTAKKTGDQASRTASPKDGSPARSVPRTSATALPSRIVRHLGSVDSENSDPNNGAGAQ